MASFQCRMCGGMVELPEGAASGECPYCGSMTTFPRPADDRVAQLAARAEQLRQQNEFDKALENYERILQIDDSDPDIHWGAVLARYGIEYVEDPVSHERIPTCHRVQFQSILVDPDYQAALEMSGGSERDLYEGQAKRIAEIQKRILAVSSQEQPYDVFICYKETTEGGTRTVDSTIAQDIYYQLTNEGYKVFFSRITLESRLGQEYEPYIFSALNSARVMLVIGTRKEYFEAVWVRNEWGRYLRLMQDDRSRLLIPCYRDMDAYDIPEELSMLQSQDMGRIGFIQDLLHGVRKVLDKDAGGSRPEGRTSEESPAKLLERAKFFLMDGDFKSVKEYCSRLLDVDPDNMEAYFHQFLAETEMTGEDVPSLFYDDPTALGCCRIILRSRDTKIKARLQAILDRMGKSRERAMEALRLLNPLLEKESGFSSIFAGWDAGQEIHGIRGIVKAVERLVAPPDETGQTSGGRNPKDFRRSRLLGVMALLEKDERKDVRSAGRPQDAVLPENRGILVRWRSLRMDMLADGLRALGGHKDCASRLSGILEERLRRARKAWLAKNYPRVIELMGAECLKESAEAQDLLDKSFEAGYAEGRRLMEEGRHRQAMPYLAAAAYLGRGDALQRAEECRRNLAGQVASEASRRRKRFVRRFFGLLGVFLFFLLAGRCHTWYRKAVRSAKESELAWERSQDLGMQLISAANEGYVKKSQVLLAEGAAVNTRNKGGSTALMMAAGGGHAEIVEVLLAAGAEIDARNAYGWTALMWAARKGQAGIVGDLLAAGADADLARQDGWTALMLAAGGGQARIVGSLLAAGADVNLARQDGWTALMLAAKQGQAGIVKALLDAGADIDAKNRKGETSLTIARSAGHAKVAGLLAAAGAK